MKQIFFIPLLVFSLLSSVLGPAAWASQCQAPPIPLPLQCESGGKFLCLNTPPGGVHQDHLFLKGRLNLENTVLGQFSVSTQHEYTKKIKNLNVSKTADQNCWENTSLQNGQLCLEKNGIFSIRVPLEDLGPYTLFVTATRLSGEPAQASARASRVLAPTMTADIISYEPDIASGNIAEGTGHVKVVVDLLQGCGEASEACDFIGAATGGVKTTVLNDMAGPPHKKILCATSTVLGGPGRFVIGVPVVPGQNQISVTVCNAATGFEPEKCPTIIGRSFQVGGIVPKIEILNPLANGPFYRDPESGPSLPLRFKITGFQQKACDQSVQVSLNTGDLAPVCPNASGIYESILQPVYGYNLAMIQADVAGTKLMEAVPFGWGKSLTPFTPQGNLKPEGEWKLKNAVRLWLPKNWINDFLVEKLNIFFNSDDFRKKIADFADMPAASSEKKEGPSSAKLPAYCQSDGSLKIRLMAPPQWEKISLKRLQFEEGRLKLPLSAQKVLLQIQLYKDEDEDGSPDIEPLPLKIVFKNIKLSPILEKWNLTSDTTDCDYKRKGLCKKMPAILVPESFEGGASSAGAFAVCDRSQKISPKMEEVCHSLNTIDRQTGGVIQEKILDAVNQAYACGSHQILGSLSTKGIALNNEMGDYALVGKLLLGDLGLKENGLAISIDTLFGDKNIFKTWSPLSKRRGAGILTAVSESALLSKGKEGSIAASLHLPLISQLFWGLTAQGGKRPEWIIDQNLFRQKLHLDFEKDCAASEEEDPRKKNPLCNVWPRAFEIFGTTITEYGYLEAKTPLTVTVIPSEAFPLRVGVVGEGNKVMLEALDWDVVIASETEPIITAKLSMKISGTIGMPLLLPEDPDHYSISFTMHGPESEFWLTEKSGGNKTVIPSSILLSNLQEKLRFTIDSFSQEGKEMHLEIPRFISLPSSSLFSQLGLQELTWGRNGFDFQLNSQTDTLKIEFLFQPVRFLPLSD